MKSIYVIPHMEIIEIRNEEVVTLVSGGENPGLDDDWETAGYNFGTNS